MNFIKKRPLLLLSILVFTLSLIIRFQIRELPNRDMRLLQSWYDLLYANGWRQLGNGTFSNYPPAYLYLLWLSTKIGDVVGRVTAIKLIPTLFDVLSAFTIFRMACLRYEDDRPYFLSAVFFILPTIFFNSSGWGQIDSTYVSFLLLCTYLLLRDKPVEALIAFGAAFSFKAQAIFLLPFLGILFLKGKLRWFHFFLVPAVYLFLAIPAALIGRSWGNIVSIYLGQVGQFRDLSRHAPNLYIFAPEKYYDTGLWIGMFIFAVCMAAWAWVNWRAKITLTQRQIMLIAVTSLTLVPFILPKMHDRYFYPADVFSFAAIIFIPEMWFIPILYQISSTLAYSVFLMGAPVIVVMVGALINTFSTLYILKKQLDSINNKDLNIE